MSVIQPRFGEDSYPIGRLILDRARALRLSRTDLVRRLGYRDLSKGHAKLTEILLTGGTTGPQPKYADVLEIDEDLVDEVLDQTACQIHDEEAALVLEGDRSYRKKFQPHLRVATERSRPEPIFIAAIFGTQPLLTVPLPEEAFSSVEEVRDQLVKAAIIEHFARQEGHVAAFGRITEYLLVLIPGYGGVDFGLPYDCAGNPAGPVRPVVSRGRIGCEVVSKHRTVLGPAARSDSRCSVTILADGPLRSPTTTSPTDSLASLFHL